eukprot:c20724_g1_i3.p1 GENE.c20724_g1_i3~~c20724_g1_i3.p1  ORF type:complete len:162 (+),score=37.50 c20724_g1_i3:139-624(+)
MTVWSIWVLWKHEATMQKMAVSANKVKTRTQQFRRKIVLLLAYVFAELIAILVHAAHAHARKHAIEDSVKGYVACLFQEQTERVVLGDSSIDLSCKLVTILPFSMVVVPPILISFNGTYLFLLFGLSEIRTRISTGDLLAQDSSVTASSVELKAKPIVIET